MATVTFVNGNGEEETFHNVRHTTTDETFLTVYHTTEAPEDMGWHDAQELHGYDEQVTQIPIDRVVRMDGAYL